MSVLFAAVRSVSSYFQVSTQTTLGWTYNLGCHATTKKHILSYGLSFTAQMYDVADQGNLLRQLKTDSMQDLMSYRPGKKAVWGVGTR